MKVKFSFSVATFLRSVFINIFAKVNSSTFEGYIDGERTMQAPTDGIACIVSDNSLLKFH